MRIILIAAFLKTILLFIIFPTVILLETHHYSRDDPLIQKAIPSNGTQNITRAEHLTESLLVRKLNATRRDGNEVKEKGVAQESPLQILKARVYEILKAAKVTNTTKQVQLGNGNTLNKKPSLLKWNELLGTALQRFYENKKSEVMAKHVVDDIKPNISKAKLEDRKSIKTILDDMDNLEKRPYRRDENPLLRWQVSKPGITTETITPTQVTKPSKQNKPVEPKKKNIKHKLQGKQNSDEYYDNPDYGNNYFNNDTDTSVVGQSEENEKTSKNKQARQDADAVEDEVADPAPLDVDPVTDAPVEVVTEAPITDAPETTTVAKSTDKTTLGPCGNVSDSVANHRVTTDDPSLKENAELDRYRWKFIKEHIEGKRRQQDDDEERWKMLPRCCDCCKYSDLGCT